MSQLLSRLLARVGAKDLLMYKVYDISNTCYMCAMSLEFPFKQHASRLCDSLYESQSPMHVAPLNISVEILDTELEEMSRDGSANDFNFKAKVLSVNAMSEELIYEILMQIINRHHDIIFVDDKCSANSRCNVFIPACSSIDELEVLLDLDANSREEDMHRYEK